MNEPRRLALLLLFSILIISQVIRIQAVHPARKHLDRILGDRNTSRFVLPFENTVIVDGTQGQKINGFFNNHVKLDLQKMAQNFSGITQEETKLLALIVVMSMPQERLRRDVIRESWAQWAPDLNMKVVFFLGIKSSNWTSEAASALIDEINTFGDIVIDNIEEAYYRLTAKVLRAFKWFLQRYSNETLRPTFFVKTDTDVFIKLRHLADVLHKVPDKRNFIGGSVCKNTPAYRQYKSKYYMPFSYWPKTEYPDYTIGPFYVISSALLPAVYNASLQEKLIQFEDLYIMGIISSVKLKLNLTDIQGFVHVRNVTRTVPDRKRNFAFHLITSEAKKLFTDLHKEAESDFEQKLNIFQRALLICNRILEKTLKYFL